MRNYATLAVWFYTKRAVFWPKLKPITDAKFNLYFAFESLKLGNF